MTTPSMLKNRKNTIAASNFGIPPEMEEEYRHGKDMRSSNHGIDTLFDISPVRLAWQKAGWHDADMEAGNRVLKCDAAS